MLENEISDLYEAVGARIKAFRKKAKLTQADLAKRLGISRTSIVNIENGRQRPPLHVLWSIAEQLNVEIVRLMPRRHGTGDDSFSIELDRKMLAQIEEASEGDAETKRHLSAFVRSVRSEMRQKETET